MQVKILSKRGLYVVALSGLVLSVSLFFCIVIKNANQNNPALLFENVSAFSNREEIIQEEIIIGLPVRLKIPSIFVDSVVIPVELTSNGAMEVPKDPAEVAWYSLGSRPGENGSAVMAGHYDWFHNVPAVFANLHKLSRGDIIFVEDEKGVNTTFVVRDIRKYSKDDDAPDVFGSNDGKSHLNLITCTGTWNSAEKTYSDRLIVFADKE